MSRRSREKGKLGEREVATLLREYLRDPRVRRGWQSRAGDDEADLEGSPWWVEVKRRGGGVAPPLYSALLQAEAAAATAGDRRTPLVFGRPDGDTRWTVTLRADDFLRLYARAEQRCIGAVQILTGDVVVLGPWETSATGALQRANLFDSHVAGQLRVYPPDVDGDPWKWGLCGFRGLDCEGTAASEAEARQMAVEALANAIDGVKSRLAL